MHYNLVSLFSEWFNSPLETSLLSKARASGLVSFEFYNPRDYAKNKHKHVDDIVYGGGAGMLIMPEPMSLCLQAIQNKASTKFILLTPVGKKLTQELAHSLAKEESLTLICGRYEGIDERICDLFDIERICVSDAVLNGGEVAAMSIIEATARLLPSFMSKEESYVTESFSENLLEYAQYTRPEEFESLQVPKVLAEGNHSKINTWRKESSLVNTLNFRPEMLDSANLNFEDLNFLKNYIKFPNKLSHNLSVALVHYPVMLPEKKLGTSSLTNLDIHDIARSSKTYGLEALHIITPIEEQKSLLNSILDFWVTGDGSKANEDRCEALNIVKHADSVQDLVSRLTLEYGEKPIVYATSALIKSKKEAKKQKNFVTYTDLRKDLEHKKVLILFGTSFGLAQKLINECDGILRPIRFVSDYNHLSVRAAAAIVLDRIFGDFT